MQTFIKKALLMASIIIAFCLAGHVASSIELINQSLLASSATFSLSFVSILGGAAKIWYSVIS